MGDVFFLVGTVGGSVERECTISEGQEILFPIINTLCFDKPVVWFFLASSIHQEGQVIAKNRLKAVSTKHQTWRLVSMVCRLKI